MPMITTAIMKPTDDRERWHTRCVVMRWSNSEVSLRQ